MATPLRRRFSIWDPLVYLVLLTYFLVVVYPMVWLLYTSLKKSASDTTDECST